MSQQVINYASDTPHHLQKSQVYSTADASTTYHLSILGEIDCDPKVYEDHCQVLRQAKENELVLIYINSPGGSVSTALQIVNCIVNCRAEVVTIVEAECMSAATLIFLAARKWVVHGNINFMIHCYSGGAWGVGREIKHMAEAKHEWVANLMKDYYKGFLTDEEITGVTENNDTIWMGSEELKTRLGNLVSYLEEAEASDQPTEYCEHREEPVMDPSEQEAIKLREMIKSLEERLQEM